MSDVPEPIQPSESEIRPAVAASAEAIFVGGMALGAISDLYILVRALLGGKPTLSQVEVVGLIGSTAFLAFMALLYFWIVILKFTAKTGVQDSDGHGRTSKTLAYFVLAAYILCQLANYAALEWTAQIPDKMSEATKTWLDLFRNGLTLLGTALTTIIGYYFGARQLAKTEDNLKAANELLKTREVSLQEVVKSLTPTSPAVTPAPSIPRLDNLD